MATTGATDALASSLGELGVGVTTVAADGVAGALADLVEPPAVGVPLPFDGASLPEGEVALDPTPAEVRDAATGVSAARFAVAEYGTLFLESDAEGTEPVSLYPPHHVAVVAASDLERDLDAAWGRLSEAYDPDGGVASGILATGVSATADMGSMVQGVHGPGEVSVVVVTDR